MRKNKIFVLTILVIALFSLGIMTAKRFLPVTQDVKNCFIESFDENHIIEEAGSMDQSYDPNWWLNSGGYLYVTNGIAHSIKGKLPENDKWRIRFFESKPETTLNGYRPQNIFRLITRKKWENTSQETYFQIKAYDLAPHENRNQSNALLLFSRYIDSDNLYYAGLRVDGKAVIKKKLAGNYYTLGLTQILDGRYDRSTNPNLIPYNQWIGIKFVIQTLAENSVLLELYLDMEHVGEWEQVLSVIDIDGEQGPLVIRQSAYSGIRTDFMDFLIREYKICESNNQR